MNVHPALPRAACEGDLETVKSLLRSGHSGGMDLALLWASSHRQFEVCLYLLGEGADVTCLIRGALIGGYGRELYEATLA